MQPHLILLGDQRVRLPHHLPRAPRAVRAGLRAAPLLQALPQDARGQAQGPIV